jgi:phosphate transport system permease protein
MYWRKIKDKIAAKSMLFAVAFANSIVLLIALGLFVKSWPILTKKSIFHLLLSSSWHPLKGEFGFYPFIIGTLEVTAIAMILAVPVCLLSAIYLSEYAHRRLRDLAHLVIDIMAAIPSVIYGLWGVIVVVLLCVALSALDIQTTGYSLLTGGIILAIMVSPIIISVSVKCSIPCLSKQERRLLLWEQLEMGSDQTCRPEERPSWNFSATVLDLHELLVKPLLS